MAKPKPYFPPNYVDAAEYAANLERELAGYRNRVAELKAMGVGEGEGSFIDAASGEEAVLAELKRLGLGEKPEKAKRGPKEKKNPARPLAETEKPKPAAKAPEKKSEPKAAAKK